MRRSALFIDFDNFFGDLLNADPAAALDVVNRPSAWLSSLAEGHVEGMERRRLILRCYMNPSGWVDDPQRPGERLYFSRFRPFFTQAGVEVVDCPPLTKNAENGADIRIVVDAMTALRADTRYDEFVIASSDSDFTPCCRCCAPMIAASPSSRPVSRRSPMRRSPIICSMSRT